ncbi:acyl carrier protein [Stenotrophomonas acidaminiphila]|jgi:acyl carrier protein|uniref:Acyl carrier protein n=1 Tax=Stenotrophomonas acidaminiphila TaxID=128780 RepID=A0A0R0DZA9_9GAMM|nr:MULTISPECIES: acyl carrier protein [Stenotrophomonas]OZB52470.1 MAG: acyl carrier protein [Stenotrophomonas sp. 14-69-23]ALJ27071.1 acyl carrier protein [Stenotrophomonas acidaminiphila]KRG87110.1 acyl carrier protein [Stenotrophomonas acidaminiphila]MTI74186.1 acyl carrier protein [Stenotrophomonas sp.]NCT88593.1 acyl carrier protein [Stenotrophomonas acidaminiphila]
MNNPSHEDQVVAVFARVLGIDAAQVTDELRYNTIPQWDSIAHMSVVAALEEAFGVMIDMDDVIDMSSVGKAREILRKHGAAL